MRKTPLLRRPLATAAFHAVALSAAGLLGGLPALAVAGIGLAASGLILKGIGAAPAFARRGDLKVFYGWKVYAVNPGAGADAELAKGGFFSDPAIVGGAYPDKEYQITGFGEAVSKAAQACNLFDDQQDVRGQVWWQCFGTEADNPLRAQLPGDPGVGDPVRCADIDIPQRSAIKAINLANRETDGRNSIDPGFGDDGNPDMEPPVGG